MTKIKSGIKQKNEINCMSLPIFLVLLFPFFRPAILTIVPIIKPRIPMHAEPKTTIITISMISIPINAMTYISFFFNALFKNPANLSSQFLLRRRFPFVLINDNLRNVRTVNDLA